MTSPMHAGGITNMASLPMLLGEAAPRVLQPLDTAAVVLFGIPQLQRNEDIVATQWDHEPTLDMVGP